MNDEKEPFQQPNDFKSSLAISKSKAKPRKEIDQNSKNLDMCTGHERWKESTLDEMT